MTRSYNNLKKKKFDFKFLSMKKPFKP